MKVLVTGATGFVGKVVVRQLLEAGDQVVVLTRNIPKAALTLGSQCQYFQWVDTNELPDAEAFNGVDAVINLMGEGIADKKWTDEQKKIIYNSRINGTQRLVEVISKLTKKPSVFVSTSAVGIYGNRGPEEITEESSAGNDFLAHLCSEWEKEASKVKEYVQRLVFIRVGVVLGHGGGALSKMLLPFKMGLGGPLGSGNQYMSWIHIEDLAAMYIEALKNNSMSGVYNGTAPYPATNSEFTSSLGKVLKRPAFLPAPSFAVKAAFGEMSTILLEGQKVLPRKFKEINFRYRYPTLEMALKETAY
jgi:uncharacterized protein (TIGR01777 family)